MATLGTGTRMAVGIDCQIVSRGKVVFVGKVTKVALRAVI
jgi:hypothetical protein